MLAVFAVVVLLCSTTLSLQQGCIGRVANPKKDLLCYYSGIMDSANLDPCVCTHLVLTGFSLDAEWNLHSARFDNLTFVDNLKETNRKLQVLVSFHLDTNLDDDLAIFTNISDDADNFAQKCTSFLQDNSLDGLELDWILTNSSSSLQHLQVLQTLGDNFKNSTNSSLVLTAALPNKAEDIIANYNVGNMSKYVDRIYLPAYGFFPTESNETFHPSRLMGVSDMQNADSLLDLVLSLGVPSEKIILGVPTFGIKYFLEHSNVTGIGAPTLGGPNVVAFHKICQQVKAGKWKVERDDDLTSPRAYSDDQWIAYDDEISIRTKGKYALLRGLAGVGVWALDDDDVSETCGEKKFPLASAARDILDQFQDAGQNMVMNSMTMDLETSASENIEQSVATLDSSSRAARSPSAFRITQIVDRLGRITAIFDNSQTELECTRAGYYRHPADCGRFFRCVKFDQFKDEFTVFEYDCPAGLVFDEKWSVCVWPSASIPCYGSSEIFPIPRNKFICPSVGYHRDPENCRWFYKCSDYSYNGYLTAFEFRCPYGLVFDEQNLLCNWPWLAAPCSGNYGRYGGEVGTGFGFTGDATYPRGSNPYAIESQGNYGTLRGVEDFQVGYGQRTLSAGYGGDTPHPSATLPAVNTFSEGGEGKRRQHVVKRVRVGGRRARKRLRAGVAKDNGVHGARGHSESGTYLEFGRRLNTNPHPKPIAGQYGGQGYGDDHRDPQSYGEANLGDYSSGEGYNNGQQPAGEYNSQNPGGYGSDVYSDGGSTEATNAQYGGGDGYGYRTDGGSKYSPRVTVSSNNYGASGYDASGSGSQNAGGYVSGGYGTSTEKAGYGADDGQNYQDDGQSYQDDGQGSQKSGGGDYSSAGYGAVTQKTLYGDGGNDGYRGEADGQYGYQDDSKAVKNSGDYTSSSYGTTTQKPVYENSGNNGYRYESDDGNYGYEGNGQTQQKPSGYGNQQAGDYPSSSYGSTTQKTEYRSGSDDGSYVYQDDSQAVQKPGGYVSQQAGEYSSSSYGTTPKSAYSGGTTDGYKLDSGYQDNNQQSNYGSHSGSSYGTTTYKSTYENGVAVTQKSSYGSGADDGYKSESDDGQYGTYDDKQGQKPDYTGGQQGGYDYNNQNSQAGSPYQTGNYKGQRGGSQGQQQTGYDNNDDGYGDGQYASSSPTPPGYYEQTRSSVAPTQSEAPPAGQGYDYHSTPTPVQQGYDNKYYGTSAPHSGGNGEYPSVPTLKSEYGAGFVSTHGNNKAYSVGGGYASSTQAYEDAGGYDNSGQYYPSSTPKPQQTVSPVTYPEQYPDTGLVDLGGASPYIPPIPQQSGSYNSGQPDKPDYSNVQVPTQPQTYKGDPGDFPQPVNQGSYNSPTGDSHSYPRGYGVKSAGASYSYGTPNFGVSYSLSPPRQRPQYQQYQPQPAQPVYGGTGEAAPPQYPSQPQVPVIPVTYPTTVRPPTPKQESYPTPDSDGPDNYPPVRPVYVPEVNKGSENHGEYDEEPRTSYPDYGSGYATTTELPPYEAPREKDNYDVQVEVTNVGAAPPPKPEEPNYYSPVAVVGNLFKYVTNIVKTPSPAPTYKEPELTYPPPTPPPPPPKTTSYAPKPVYHTSYGVSPEQNYQPTPAPKIVYPLTTPSYGGGKQSTSAVQIEFGGSYDPNGRRPTSYSDHGKSSGGFRTEYIITHSYGSQPNPGNHYIPSAPPSPTYEPTPHSGSYNSPTPQSYTPSPNQYSPGPSPYTPAPKPYTPSPESYTQTPKPYTPAPKSYTPTPKPYSPSPTSYRPLSPTYTQAPHVVSSTPAYNLPSTTPHPPRSNYPNNYNSRVKGDNGEVKRWGYHLTSNNAGYQSTNYNGGQAYGSSGYPQTPIRINHPTGQKSYQETYPVQRNYPVPHYSGNQGSVFNQAAQNYHNNYNAAGNQGSSYGDGTSRHQGGQIFNGYQYASGSTPYDQPRTGYNSNSGQNEGNTGYKFTQYGRAPGGPEGYEYGKGHAQYVGRDYEIGVITDSGSSKEHSGGYNAGRDSDDDDKDDGQYKNEGKGSGGSRSEGANGFRHVIVDGGSRGSYQNNYNVQNAYKKSEDKAESGGYTRNEGREGSGYQDSNSRTGGYGAERARDNNRGYGSQGHGGFRHVLVDGGYTGSHYNNQNEQRSYGKNAENSQQRTYTSSQNEGRVNAGYQGNGRQDGGYEGEHNDKYDSGENNGREYDDNRNEYKGDSRTGFRHVIVDGGYTSSNNGNNEQNSYRKNEDNARSGYSNNEGRVNVRYQENGRSSGYHGAGREDGDSSRGYENQDNQKDKGESQTGFRHVIVENSGSNYQNKNYHQSDDSKDKDNKYGNVGTTRIDYISSTIRPTVSYQSGSSTIRTSEGYQASTVPTVKTGGYQTSTVPSVKTNAGYQVTLSPGYIAGGYQSTGGSDSRSGGGYQAKVESNYKAGGGYQGSSTPSVRTSAGYQVTLSPGYISGDSDSNSGGGYQAKVESNYKVGGGYQAAGGSVSGGGYQAKVESNYRSGEGYQASSTPSVRTNAGYQVTLSPGYISGDSDSKSGEGYQATGESDNRSGGGYQAKVESNYRASSSADKSSSGYKAASAEIKSGSNYQSSSGSNNRASGGYGTGGKSRQDVAGVVHVTGYQGEGGSGNGYTTVGANFKSGTSNNQGSYGNSRGKGSGTSYGTGYTSNPRNVNKNVDHYRRIDEDGDGYHARPSKDNDGDYRVSNVTYGAAGSIQCDRAGLFRHPEDCNQFYECYWDRWIQKYTIHFFHCPVRLVYDNRITGCNWPLFGPTCNKKY